MTYKKDLNIGTLLKKAQNSTSHKQVLAFMRRELNKKSQYYILTLNPEIALLASKYPKFGKILAYSDILISDGIGLTLANNFLKKKHFKNCLFSVFAYFFQLIAEGIKIVFVRDKKVLKGRELFMEIIKMGNKYGLKVFFLGGKGDEALKTKNKLKLSFKRIKIESYQGPMLDLNGLPLTEDDLKKEKEAIQKINAYKPDILFVAFGAPKQEYWIERVKKMVDVRGIMAVGGTFNYISGNLSLPSKFFENAGLEWLWRLISQPKRIIRVINAVFVFPLKVYLYKLNLK